MFNFSSSGTGRTKRVAERLNRKFVVDALQQHLKINSARLKQGPVQIIFTFPSMMVTAVNKVDNRSFF